MNLNNLGLCKAAKGLIVGESKVLDKIKSKEAYLVILASDTGVNTFKRIKDKTSFYNINLNTEHTSSELSRALGMENVHVIAIMNRGFAKLLEK